MNKEKWFAAVRANVSGLSRTTKGVSDTSSSADKPKLEVEGASLALQSALNLERSLDFLWENRATKFASPESLRAFLEKLATLVSQGLLKPGQGLWRTWVTKFSHQSRPESIQAEFREFCSWLYSALLSNESAVEIAALVELRLDSRLHPFADGCGRTSKLLSAWVLLRSELYPPSYPARREYYSQIEQTEPQWIAFYRTLLTGLQPSCC